jgi:NodT family efflux transporter outer membrane factor (OMF) lipoprotein
MMKPLTMTVVSTAALLLAACAVGPHYVAPRTVVAPDWIEPQAGLPADGRWWLGFEDPELTRLIEAATAGSPDLRAAEARLAEARASHAAARGGALPQGEATASYSHDRVSENGEIPIGHIPGFRPEFDLFDGGFDASWEVDLWGRQRRTIQAAAAREQAAEAARRDTLVQLRAEVARTYFQLRAAQQNLAAARADAEAQRRDADLVTRRFAGGEASRFDLTRAEAQARATEASLPDLEGDVREAAFTLARLIGRPPEAEAAALLKPGLIPAAPAALGVGLRSDILRRRPDIVEAERNLAAATADAGVAVAALFPRLTLSGAISQQSQTISALTLAGSNTFQVGPSLSWPILQQGTLRANVRAANARTDQAAAAYESAVFAALADSETALNRFARAGETERQAAAALNAAREGLDLAEQRYQAGEDDLLPVLTAQSSAAQARRKLNDARQARATSAVSVYKALGL